MRRLYYVSGRVFQMGCSVSVWGAHLWANDAADARAIARQMIDKDREAAPGLGLHPLPPVTEVIAKPSKSDPSNAMNSF